MNQKSSGVRGRKGGLRDGEELEEPTKKVFVRLRLLVRKLYERSNRHK